MQVWQAKIAILCIYLAIYRIDGSMTAAVRTTTATVHRAVPISKNSASPPLRSEQNPVKTNYRQRE